MSVRSSVFGVAWVLGLASVAVAAEPSGHGSTLVSATFPQKVLCGASLEVTVTFTNSGDVPWVKGEVALAAREGTNAFSETRRVELPAEVQIAPGENHVFTLRLAAPEIPLESTLVIWQLVHEGEPFGEAASAEVAVECPSRINDAEVEATSLPASLECGQRFDGWVRLLNTGTAEWSARESYRLIAVEAAADGEAGHAGPTIAGPTIERTRGARLSKGAVVRPGESHRFAVSMVAPRVEGRFDVAWQMAEDEAVFGEVIEQPIAVKCPTSRAGER